jgi:MerR family mercuric resistance operon transcriptional regulator
LRDILQRAHSFISVVLWEFDYCRSTSGGRRVYDANHLRILAFIRRSRELGFSLNEIRALIRLGGPAKVSCRQVRDIASQHLDISAPKSPDRAG